MNAMGTDVTAEIIGKDASIGNSGMAFTPHSHTSVSALIPKCAKLGGQDLNGGSEGTGKGARFYIVDGLGLYGIVCIEQRLPCYHSWGSG